MKTKNIFLRTMLIAATASLVVTGCRKEEEDSNTSAASDQALAESTYNDLDNIADEANKTGTLTNYRLGDQETAILSTCATVTFDTLNHADADTMTVDFGTTNCTCNDGRNRRGAINVVYTGRYRDSSTVITITPNNYFVNDNQVLGSRTITNMGHNAAGHLVYNISVSGQIILASNGGTITWQSTRQREWITGESTPAWSDDVYSITGSGSGTSAEGVSYTANITSALIRNMAVGCRRHFTQGVVELTPSNKPMRTIDFGTGTCDDIATVTINNHTYTIHLR